MSDFKRTRSESEGHSSTFNFLNSRDYTNVSDFNINKDFLFTSLSTGTPTNLTNKKKKPLSIGSEGKEMKKLEKENIILAENIRKLENTIENLKKENLKLRANFEKVEYQKNGFSTMLQKLNEENKQKAEQIKKQSEYIKKLESQLLMGSLHHNLYEENKKLKDRIQNLEDEVKEKGETIMELSDRLAKLSRDMETYKQAAEINLIEFNENLEDNKINFKDFIEYVEARGTLQMLREENENLRNMLNEHGSTAESVSKELEHLQIKLENQEVEIESYKNAIKDSHNEITSLKQMNEELLQKETSYLDKIRMLEMEKNEMQTQLEGEKNIANEAKKKYEELSKQHRGLMNDFENMIKENADLKKTNLELKEYAKTVADRFEIMEKEKEEAIRRINEQAMEQSSELKDKLLREKNMAIEQLHNKLKMYEKDMKEIFNKNTRLEESCNKYQEMLDFSYQFIQNMEQKFYKMLNEEQSNKKLKVDIHKLIESCIKQMLESHN